MGSSLQEFVFLTTIKQIPLLEPVTLYIISKSLSNYTVWEIRIDPFIHTMLIETVAPAGL